MATFMLTHIHTPGECAIVYAAWRGFESPLRRAATVGSCAGRDGNGNHRLWWTVQAESADEALALLPEYLAERTDASEVGEVAIP